MKFFAQYAFVTKSRRNWNKFLRLILVWLGYLQSNNTKYRWILETTTDIYRLDNCLKKVSKTFTSIAMLWSPPDKQRQTSCFFHENRWSVQSCVQPMCLDRCCGREVWHGAQFPFTHLRPGAYSRACIRLSALGNKVTNELRENLNLMFATRKFLFGAWATVYTTACPWPALDWLLSCCEFVLVHNRLQRVKRVYEIILQFIY